MAKPVKIAILGDASSLTRALNKASRESQTKLGRISGDAQRMGKSLGKAFAVGGAAAAAGVAVFAKASVDAAKELQQNLGGAEAVFGKYADTVKKKGADAYKTLGVSQSDYLATANKMGSLFQGSGHTVEKSLELTTKAMQRATDVASVMGVDSATAMEAVTGAAKGNFEMMDNLGVAMNATTIEAYALEKGMNFKWNTASQAEKTEVAMKMFFDKTSKYAGNFKKESKTTLQGSLDTLRAKFDNLQANVGMKLLPVLTKFTVWLSEKALPYVEKMYPIIRDNLGGAFDRVKASLDKVMPVFEAIFGFLKDNPAVIKNVAITVGILSAAFTVYAGVMAVVNAVMLASPITWIVLGIVALVAGITLLVTNWDKVTAAVKRFGSYIAGGFMSLLGKIAGWAKGVGANIWDGIKSVGSKLRTIGTWIWSNVYPGPLLKLAGKVLSFAKSIGGKVWSGITSIGGKLRTIGTWIWNNFYPGPLVRLGARVLGTAKSIGGKIWTGVKSIGSSLRTLGSWAWDRFSGGLSRLKDRFTTAGKGLISGLVSGMRSKWADIKSLTKAPLNGIITGAINPFIGKINGWIPGKGPIATVNTFARGGWTGPGSKYQPAGVVHADEYVINKASRRKIEQKAPGLLDRLNGYASGGRVWPLRGGVTSTYAGHSGVDLNAPNDYGAPVFAVTSGVAYPYSSSWAGSHSVMLRGGGTTQIYAHLSGRGRMGSVSAGSVIGYVGSEGNSTGPHLHFQIDPSGYGPAMGFLQGASQPTGGGGFSLKDFVVGKAEKLLSPLLKNLDGGGVIPASGIRALGSDYLKKFLKDIPGLASGGIVRARAGGTLALLGEGGQDEAVVPLTRGAGGGRVVEVHHHYSVEVKTGVGDPVAIGREVNNALKAYRSAGGRVQVS